MERNKVILIGEPPSFYDLDEAERSSRAVPGVNLENNNIIVAKPMFADVEETLK